MIWSKPRRHGRVEEPSEPLVEEIEERVNAFLSWPTEESGSILWIDFTYVKVREVRRLLPTAVVIAVRVNTGGGLEVPCITSPSKTKTFWKGSLRALAGSGLRGVKLVAVDDHRGLRAAASKVFTPSAVTWTGCATP